MYISVTNAPEGVENYSPAQDPTGLQTIAGYEQVGFDRGATRPPPPPDYSQAQPPAMQFGQ